MELENIKAALQKHIEARDYQGFKDIINNVELDERTNLLNEIFPYINDPIFNAFVTDEVLKEIFEYIKIARQECGTLIGEIEKNIIEGSAGGIKKLISKYPPKIIDQFMAKHIIEFTILLITGAFSKEESEVILELFLRTIAKDEIKLLKILNSIVLENVTEPKLISTIIKNMKPTLPKVIERLLRCLELSESTRQHVLKELQSKIKVIPMHPEWKNLCENLLIERPKCITEDEYNQILIYIENKNKRIAVS